MIEIEAKQIKGQTVEEIENEIVEAFDSKEGDTDLMVVDVDDDYLLSFLKALSNLKPLFLDTSVLPVIKTRPKELDVQSLLLALMALAL